MDDRAYRPALDTRFPAGMTRFLALCQLSFLIYILISYEFLLGSNSAPTYLGIGLKPIGRKIT
jgi:hypothetical protein